MKLIVLAALLSLAGCGVLPAGGPTASDLVEPDSAAMAAFDVVEVTDDVLRVAGAPVDDSFAGKFGGRGARGAPVVGVGDILSVTIFESALGGLFTAPESSIGAASKSVTLPQIAVDARGYIRVPFADLVRASGRTTRALEDAIEAKLKGRAIDPQVVVTLVSNRSSLVTVSGDVRAPNRFPVGTANERLLDVIAMAGGAISPPHETRVRLIRGERSASASLKTVAGESAENVYIRPGDTVIVEKRARSVTILGAAARNAELRFEKERMTLAEAIGAAGGLTDARADPKGVFVLRYEQPRIRAALQPGWTNRSGLALAPTIYRVDLRSAGGYFRAQAFNLRDKDLVYVANADGVQLGKMLQLVSLALANSQRVNSIGN